MNSSKGNQYKFRDGSYWYKKDSLGYEALAETVVSFILNHSNVSGFVEYSPCKKEFKGALCNFSRSKNFLMDGQNQLKISCTANAVCEEAQRYSAYYDSGILTRIQHLVRVQWRKYSYLCSGADVR